MPSNWPGPDRSPTIIEKMDGTTKSAGGKGGDWPGPGANYNPSREPSAPTPASSMTKTGPKIKEGK